MAKRRDFFELYELIEQTGFLFNPIITYTGSFLLRTGSLTGVLTYEEDKDTFVINSKVENGKNKYKEFCNKHFVHKFGNPPSKGIAPAITPILMSEMNPDGHGRSVKFSYTPTLLVLLEDPTLVVGAPDSEPELALYVKDQIKIKRDKMFNVLRLWDKSPYYEEIRDRYESHGYVLSYDFLEKQKDYFTKLIFLLKDISKACSVNDFDKESFEDCFEKDKMILMLCKCIVDNCKETAKNENSFHNCMVEVIQLIQNVKELGLDKDFNPCIKIYDEEKKKYVIYSFADLKREVAQMLSEHPEFEVATIQMQDAVSKNLVRNAEATTKFGEILTARKKQVLAANWEFVKPGEREDKEQTEAVDFDTQMRRRDAKISSYEKDAYLELMRKRLFFDKTGYMEQILGINSFAGYVGYIYANGLVIFEKMYEDDSRLVPVKEANATYVMNIDNFVELSALSKTDIIKYIKSTVNPNVKRVYHSKNWEQRLLSIIEGAGYDAVEEKIDTLIETGRVRKETKGLGTGKGKK